MLQVVRQYLQTRGFQLDENGVRFVFMAVNAYIRSYKRKKIIEAIEEEHIHFFGWLTDQELLNKSNLIHHGVVSY